MGRGEGELGMGEEGGEGWAFSSLLALESFLGALRGLEVEGESTCPGSCLIRMRLTRRASLQAAVCVLWFARDCLENPTKSQPLQANGSVSGCLKRMWAFNWSFLLYVLPQVEQVGFELRRVTKRPVASSRLRIRAEEQDLVR